MVFGYWILFPLCINPCTYMHFSPGTVHMTYRAFPLLGILDGYILSTSCVSIPEYVASLKNSNAPQSSKYSHFLIKRSKNQYSKSLDRSISYRNKSLRLRLNSVCLEMFQTEFMERRELKAVISLAQTAFPLSSLLLAAIGIASQRIHGYEYLRLNLIMEHSPNSTAQAHSRSFSAPPHL